MFRICCLTYVISSGYNSGRTYYIGTHSKELLDKLFIKLKKYAKIERRKAEASSIFRKWQLKVRKRYESGIVQGSMALLIGAVSFVPHPTFPPPTMHSVQEAIFVIVHALYFQNFGCTITEAQFINNLVNPDGSPTELSVMLDKLNLFFTLLFTVELAVNMFSHWFQPFIQNAWSLLDTFIVAMSVMSLIVTNQPTGIVRILRALRVIRLFGRVKSLRKIISALSLALAPVLNVFLILFLLMGICEFLLPKSHCQDGSDAAAASLQKSPNHRRSSEAQMTHTLRCAWSAPARVVRLMAGQSGAFLPCGHFDRSWLQEAVG